VPGGTVSINLASGVAPVNYTLNISGHQPGNVLLAQSGLFVPNGGFGFFSYDFFTTSGTASSPVLQYAPASIMQPGEFHVLFAQLEQTSGNRQSVFYNSPTSAVTTTWPPAITDLVACVLPGAAPVQVQAMGEIDGVYDDFTTLGLHQSLPGGGARSTFVTASYEYATGTTIDWTTPNFTGGNYNPLHGLQQGVPITADVIANGSNVVQGSYLQMPVNGLRLDAADKDLGTLGPCPPSSRVQAGRLTTPGRGAESPSRGPLIRNRRPGLGGTGRLIPR
jgi:hypothetical protein